MTYTQFVILSTIARLSKQQKNISQSDIANQANSDRMVVSKLLRHLEQRNLVSRKLVKEDRRSNAISLTRHGRHVLSKVTPVLQHMDQSFFAALGARESAFATSMRKLIQAYPDV